jgi:tryptophan synthase alpha chain
VTRITEACAGPAVIAFTVAGDPNPGMSARIARTLIDAGADILELGVPFSDPSGDGPAIQKADERALSAGTTTDTVFSIVREIRSFSDIPIVLLTYYNPVYRRGPDRFYRDASAAGVDGILIADLPIEEADEVVDLSRRHGIDQIFLVSRDTSPGRLKEITGCAGGFLYLVSVHGVTGARPEMAGDLPAFIHRVRQQTVLPMAVGFGISTPDHVSTVFRAGGDGAIVGSAIVEIIGKNLSCEPEMIDELHAFVSYLTSMKEEIYGSST